MTSINQAFITPEVVRWARERARATRDKLAQRLHTRAERVASWEDGTHSPTLAQAQKLAEALRIPFGYLFLPSPPKEQVPLPDFRRVGSAASEPLSADFMAVLNDVIVKQNRYRELLLDSADRVACFAKYSIGDPDKLVAEDIAATLKIDDQLRRACANFEEFIRQITRQAEAVGILVMRSGVACGNSRRPLSVAEFRGFAIGDPLAPLVFVNGKDAPPAQIFTLVHELAHIWIGASGISNVSLKDADVATGTSDIERFCNRVAAEVLIPEDVMLRDWQAHRGIEDNVQAISRHCKVSRLVTLRRAYGLHKISREKYAELYVQEERKFKARQQGGGSYFLNVLARNGATFTEAIVTAAMGGKLLYRDAAGLLNISVPSIHKLADYLSKRREAA